MGEDIGFTRTAADQVPEHPDRRGRHHGRRFRHRGPGRRVRADATSPGSIERIRRRRPGATPRCTTRSASTWTAPPAQDGRKIMLLYTDGGDTRSAHALQRAARSAQGVGRHGLRHRLPRAPVARRAGAAASGLQQIAEATGGQAFFPTSVKELDTVYEKVAGRDPRAVHARLHLDQRQDRRRLAEGRDQAEPASDGRDSASAPARATSRRLRKALNPVI